MCEDRLGFGGKMSIYKSNIVGLWAQEGREVLHGSGSNSRGGGKCWERKICGGVSKSYYNRDQLKLG